MPCEKIFFNIFKGTMVTSVLFLIALLHSTLSATKHDGQCKAGLTGVNCELPCPGSCETCDRASQDCTGYCKHQRRFGKRCEQICPEFCSGTCNITTGACSRCSHTFGGTFCNISCPTNCRSTCDMNTMECHQCKTGFTGIFCDDICPVGRPNTTEFNTSCIEPCPDEGRYGDDCDKPCPGNCSDGCYRDTGECVNCAEGFGGRFCDDSCPENCFNGCDRYRGICNYCQSRYHGQKCSNMCPINCKEECHQKNGHCLECKSGFQGEKCNKKCPKHCNGGCNQTTGVCNTCATGFMGHYCNDSCENNCKEGCKQITGECMECQLGFTGLFCGETCSRFCRDECEQTSGECIGCIDGYTGTVCNETCPTKCLGNCYQYTGECDLDATGNTFLRVLCGAFGAALMVLGITLMFIMMRKQRRLMQIQDVGLAASYSCRLDNVEASPSLATPEVMKGGMTDLDVKRVPSIQQEDNTTMKVDEANAVMDNEDKFTQKNCEDTRGKTNREDTEFEVMDTKEPMRQPATNDQQKENERMRQKHVGIEDDYPKVNQAIATPWIGMCDHCAVSDSRTFLTSENLDEEDSDYEIFSFDQKNKIQKEDVPEKIYVDIMVVKGY